jgi:glycine cleavage system regulatory protein
MNANELADELEKCIDDGSTDLICVEQAANMLRQQQAEIEELKAKFQREFEYVEKLLTAQEK